MEFSHLTGENDFLGQAICLCEEQGSGSLRGDSCFPKRIPGACCSWHGQAKVAFVFSGGRKGTMQIMVFVAL